MKGKEKCEILRQIRQQIARENDIPLAVAECTHLGECRGTCPRCEAEVRYLEQALSERRRMRRHIALAGISAGMTLALTGCSPIRQLQEAAGRFAAPAVQPSPDPLIEELTGAVGLSEPGPVVDLYILDGEVTPMDYIEFEAETTGMVVPEDR